jgi:pimeloyl-ACP methyl ester carboxylesterase
MTLHAPMRQWRAGDSRPLDQRSTAPAPRWRDVAAEGGELFGRLRTRYQMPELSSLPHGDGHPVLVLPGLLSADWMTRGFRGVLTALGYQVEGWGAGINLGPTESAWRITAERLLTVAAGSGRQVSLVGHSLGGVLGRALAHEHPALVRRVITVCSPFHPPSRARSNHCTACCCAGMSIRIFCCRGSPNRRRSPPPRSTRRATGSSPGRAVSTFRGRAAKM